MTTVASVLTIAGSQCSITAPPNGWAGATGAARAELRDVFLMQTVDDILDRIDATSPLSGREVITGTGDATYNLPADFRRVHRDSLAVYERSPNRRPCMRVSSRGEWNYIREFGASGAYRYYRIRGYDGNFTIDFFNDLEVGAVVIVCYATTSWLLHDGVAADTFTNEDDVILLPRRLVEAGIVWRFRSRKGLPYADKNAEYEALMIRFQNQSKGFGTINFGEGGRSPWDIPVPDVLTGDV
jgi:hypothetical protein